ncbi:autophagy-related protein 7 [Hordeum vulgare]|nr:autophagy-related protein 7 [Hordeum vulgare]
MASAPDAFSSTNLGSQSRQDEDLGDFFEKLDLHEDEFDDVIVEEEAPELADEIPWLALARVQTNKNFSQAAFFKDMRAAWNTAKPISRSVDEIIKGKSPVAMDPICGTVKSVSREPWPPPLAGMVALSIDGSYRASDGSAGSGMILRTRTGEVVFAAYRKLFHCNDALEAELQALLEGIKLTTKHSEAPIMIQSDCVVAINAIKDTSLDNSAYGHMIEEIKFLLSDRVFILVKVSRASK